MNLTLLKSGSGWASALISRGHRGGRERWTELEEISNDTENVLWKSSGAGGSFLGKDFLFHPNFSDTKLFLSRCSRLTEEQKFDVLWNKVHFLLLLLPKSNLELMNLFISQDCQGSNQNLPHWWKGPEEEANFGVTLSWFLSPPTFCPTWCNFKYKYFWNIFYFWLCIPQQEYRHFCAPLEASRAFKWRNIIF